MQAFYTSNELSEALLHDIDLLGDRFMEMHSPEDRRATGSIYTPSWLVQEMVSAAKGFAHPDTIVDCGCGSGRFALACAHAFPNARIIAVDSSPEACAMCRENVDALQLNDRVSVVCLDFLDFDLPADRGRVLWIGNPPYVRHHDIPVERKEWLAETSCSMGLGSSALAGLHAYFLVKIASLWNDGDAGMLVTSSEWLDTKYGSLIRNLLTDYLAVRSIELFDRGVPVFSSTDTTAVVFSFGDGSDSVGIGMHGCGQRIVAREELAERNRWSSFVAGNSPVASKEGLVPLGSIAEVHRGVVTGNNRFWVRGQDELKGIPQELTCPIVSHAHEIMEDGIARHDLNKLNRLIVIPENLDELPSEVSSAANRLIADGRRQGIDEGYVASHRRRWWAVKPPKAPAIMMTYMSRRKPSFMLNKSQLPMLNVVHGIYPKQEMSSKALRRLVEYLNRNASIDDGRMYCGGLVKFEPKEAESILVPELASLER